MPTTSTKKTSKSSSSAPPVDNSYGRLQPQAVEIEQAVLGALMIDSMAFDLVHDVLHPATFYETRHQHIYTAIQALSYSDRPIDMMTVVEELRRQGTLETVGGDTYIMDLTARVASSAHIVYHAHILAQKALARQLISYASTIEGRAFDETEDVNELMQEAEAQLFELSQQNIRQDYRHIAPILRQAEEDLKVAAANPSGMTGIPTGYHRLDKITNGWQNSDLIILAGRPAMGKTSLALSIVKNMCVDRQIPVGFFSLEMSDVQLADRLMSNVFEIEGTKILSGQLDKDEWQRFDKNIERLRQAPLYIDETASLSVFELRTKARRLVREKGVKIIVIDYLQLMTASGMRYGNRQEEVSHISKALKGLAKELKIPIIALAQLNRSVEVREGIEAKRPQLSDLRESGAIEQDADLVLFVHRPEYYKIYEDRDGSDLRGKAEVIIAKHRKGATDIVRLRFAAQYTRFEDITATAPTTDGSDAGEIIDSRYGSDEARYALPTDDDPLGGPLADIVPY